MKKFLSLSLFLFISSISNAQLLDTIPICMVTVDTASTHNIIYWEKGSLTTYDSVRIYKQQAGGLFIRIASVAFNDTSEYHDYTVNPNAKAEFYRIAGVTPIGIEGPRSRFHKTIRMLNLGSGLMGYNDYEIENTANPSPQYDLFRDNTGTGGFGSTPISSIGPGISQVYDFAYSSFPNANYVVQTNWTISCDPSRAIINSSRSNVKSQMAVDGIEAQEFLNKNISIFQEGDELQLTFKNAVLKEAVYWEIYDQCGKLTARILIPAFSNAASFNTASLSQGMYISRLYNSGFSFSSKFTVEH